MQRERRMTPRLRAIAICVLAAALLAGWVFWLRAPSFRVPLWNLDEGADVAIANSLRHGAVMYRDIVDHRTPLSYYVTAGLFSFTGTSPTALHVLVAALIAAVAFGLFLLGRRNQGTATGALAAGIFAATACYLIPAADAYAAHTEWFLIAFTTAAALVFCGRPGVPSLQRAGAVGLLLGCGFLSKQTATLELGAPLGALAYALVVERAPGRLIARAAAGLIGGFALVIGFAAGLLALAGGWRDGVFYTWTYNVRYYGPETGWTNRLQAPGPFLRELAATYPLVLLTALAGAAVLAVRVVQLRRAEKDHADRTAECYSLLWCGTSFAAAMASGRTFEHYFIEFMPPLAWLAAWLPGWLGRALATSQARMHPVARMSGLLGFAIFAGWIAIRPLAARREPPPPPDPALRVSAYIRAHSRPADRLFVWGFYPELYLYTDRLPASRFVYCTFQTGMIPWTNVALNRDTRYAIVPGTLDTLVQDLERQPPAFIVDTSAGPNRMFQKYPLRNFPRLAAFAARHYVEVEADTFNPQGFRLLMRRDPPVHGAPRPDGAGRHPVPGIGGPEVVGTGTFMYTAYILADKGPVEPERLALLVDGVEVAAVRSPPSPSLVFRMPLSFDAKQSPKHQLRAVAFWSDGTQTATGVKQVAVTGLDTSPAQQLAFALPRIAGELPAVGVRALFNPRADRSGNERVFALHAPSLLRYELPADATGVLGSFGLPAGAYAPENKSPTDGAEFIVRIVEPNAAPRVLLDRLLRPATVAADRPVQRFHLTLPPHGPGTTLEFEVGTGPNGDASSDWAFWSDVMLETSR